MVCKRKRSNLRALQVMAMRECGLSRIEIAKHLNRSQELVRMILSRGNQRIFTMVIHGEFINDNRTGL